MTCRATKLWLGIALLIALCGPLGAQKVRWYYLSGTTFSQYKTYKWIPIEGNMAPDPTLEQQIRQTIDAQLAKKGFTNTNDGNADLYVGYQVAVDQEKRWNAYSTGPGTHWATLATNPNSTIQAGTLCFDVYDRANQRIVWRGWATKALNPPQAPDKQKLEKAVARLLRQFPPLPSMTRHGRH
jgi:hypothetical protein